MRKLARRNVLRSGGALASLWLAGQSSEAAAAAPARSLVRDPKGILELPPGFSYQVLSRFGDRMSDGYVVPNNPDAMGVFAAGDALVLMRNHEIAPGDRASGPYPDGVSAPPEAYDPEAYGGVTRLVLDAHTLARRSDNLALCGTHWNCAGGLSPWGWLTCEELFIPQHGYVFLCAADAPHVMPPHRIPGYGRFRHEAATVDPRTHIAYLSEDREDAALYRFLPDRASDPFRGRLQALRVIGQPAFETGTMLSGQSQRIDWVDVPNPDPQDDDVRYQAHAKGAARFVRTEGIWLHGDELYFCATAGGPIGRGQIFRLDLDDMRLTLLVQTTDTSVLDMPDNITVAPNGQLYVAEDGLDGNFIHRISPQGRVTDFARNAGSTSEFAGPCFSPDGSTLFVNIQHDGLTLAIRGPFAAEADLATHHVEPPTRRPSTPELVGIGAGVAALALAALARRKRTPPAPASNSDAPPRSK